MYTQLVMEEASEVNVNSKENLSKYTKLIFLHILIATKTEHVMS